MYKTSESDGFVEFSLKQIHIKTMKILFNKTQYILNAQVFFKSETPPSKTSSLINQKKEKIEYIKYIMM